MKKAELDKYIGQKVKILFFDNMERVGVLGFTKEFSAKYGFRKPNCYTIDDVDFKVSHIKKLIPV